MFRFVRNFTRHPTEVIKLFEDLPTTIISDVMGRSGAMDSGIKPVSDQMRVVGTAFTVKTYTSDNLMCHLAIKLALPGDVLVIDADSYLDAAIWGELTSLSAKVHNLAGVIIDGAVRDRTDLQQLGFPVFARGIVAAGTFKVNLGEINVPIACGGLTVHPGDLIVGDADGVVVVPQAQLDPIAKAARAQVAKEEEYRKKILAGEILYDVLGLERYLRDQPISWE